MATYNGKFLILNRSGAGRTGVIPSGAQLLLENDSTPYRKLWVGDGTTAGGISVAAQAIISSLTEDVTPDAANDYVVTWDASAGVNKKVKASNLPAQAIISSLTEDITPDAANDYVVTWDASAGVNKKVKASNLPAQAIISSLTEDVTPDAANDYVVTWDASVGANKKVKVANLPGSGQSSSFSYVTIGSDSTPLTTNTSVTITDTNTYISLYVNGNINLRLDYSSSTQPVSVIIEQKHKRSTSQSCDLTISANSSTPWTGVARPGGGSPEFTSLVNAIDMVSLIYNPGLQSWRINNLINHLI